MATLAVLSALVVMATVLLPATAWSDWDARVTYSCLNGQILTGMQSRHNNKREDRQWQFKCSTLPVQSKTKSCKWTDFQNDYDQPLFFKCPNDGVIAGVDSIHNNGREDRKFKFLCCQVEDYITDHCALTGFKNDFDQPLNYVVPQNKVLVGVFSVHDNKREDRRFRFEECSLDPCGSAWG